MFKKRPRLTEFPYVAYYRYFLTFCAHDRQKVFTAAETVNLVLRQITRAAVENEFEIPAYVFMPNHVHLLGEGRSDSSDLKLFARAAKQYSGFEYSQSNGNRLWQPSYFDHVLRDEDDTWESARYIVWNPIRDGLVEKVDDYPSWDLLSLESKSSSSSSNRHQHGSTSRDR